MTLEELKGVKQQIQAQYDQVYGMVPTADKPVILLTNCIEIRGALQCLDQLLMMEQQKLCAPPGSTGPQL